MSSLDSELPNERVLGFDRSHCRRVGERIVVVKAALDIRRVPMVDACTVRGVVSIGDVGKDGIRHPGQQIGFLESSLQSLGMQTRRHTHGRPAGRWRARGVGATRGVGVEGGRSQNRCHVMSTDVARHMTALPTLTITARLQRWPLCSYSHSAIVALAPSHVSQVTSECWLESPLLWMAHNVGRYENTLTELKTAKAQVSRVR
jgi:hypothetical protein